MNEQLKPGVELTTPEENSSPSTKSRAKDPRDRHVSLAKLATLLDRDRNTLMGGGYPDETRGYTARFPARRNIWAIKGRNNSKGTRSTAVWPKRANRSNKLGVTYYLIDSQLARDGIYRLMQLRGDNAPMFPQSLKADFIEKLMCEERKRINGGWYWQPKRGHRAEEEWMCLAYAFAALKGLQHSRLAWRDLNLAADNAGIPVLPPHDPETGELLEDSYDGPDRSVAATAVQEIVEPDKHVQPSRPAKAKPEVSRPTSTHPAVAVTKQNVGRVLRRQTGRPGW